MVSTPEPMGKLFHQGMITSFAFKRADGSLVPVDEVDADKRVPPQMFLNNNPAENGGSANTAANRLRYILKVVRVLEP